MLLVFLFRGKKKSVQLVLGSAGQNYINRGGEIGKKPLGWKIHEISGPGQCLPLNNE